MYRHEVMKFARALENTATIGLLILIIALSSYVTDELGIWFYEKQLNENKVFDLIHEFTPDFHEYGGIVNLIPLLFLGTFLFTKGNLIWEFAEKFLILIFLRSITIFFTILPKHENCFKRFQWSTCLVGQCYDKIFSGHTALTVLAALLLNRGGYIPTWLGILFVGVETLFILLTRSHYSVDVLFAMVITYLVYDKKTLLLH
jgi:hypothetical protein